MRIVTIGVYGYTEEMFFNVLHQAEVDLFCDIRWRRAVRGSAYAFANSERLQARLEEIGIRYMHVRAIAPPPELRQIQADLDRTQKVAKRKRQELSGTFVQAYQEQVLADFDLDGFVESLSQDGQVLALFCVERIPAACHRSIFARILQSAFGWEVTHLYPP